MSFFGWQRWNNEDVEKRNESRVKEVLGLEVVSRGIIRW